MEIKLFTKILSDKHFTEYKQLNYKYGKDFKDFITKNYQF